VSSLTREQQRRLKMGAQAVLQSNDLGGSTKPAPDLYPHQWNWDSCFISVGIAHYDSARAVAELRSLLRGQWDNGLVPQIVFNPRASGYFPGPDVWQCRRSPHAPKDVQTSGITQPPVLASAALRIWEAAEDKERVAIELRNVLPGILRYHEWLYRERDPDQSGLITVVHPWESGLDNSPPYLDAGSRVHMKYKPRYERLDTLHVAAANRPTNKDYDLFVYLLEQMREDNWDQVAYLKRAPLAVEDVLFNSVLCRANRDLARLSEVLGSSSDQATEWFRQTSTAIQSKLWSARDNTFYSYDRNADHLLKDDTITGLHALYGSAATSEQARAMIDGQLLSAQKFWPAQGLPIPTTAVDSHWFNPENYWLGPVWVNTNWMVSEGLDTYGRADLATAVREATLTLVERSGFREYFHPVTGEGYGTDSFSWSAALTLDLLAREGV